MKHVLLSLILAGLCLSCQSQDIAYFNKFFFKTMSEEGATYVEVGSNSTYGYKKSLYLLKDSTVLSETWYKSKKSAETPNFLERRTYFKDGSLKSRTDNKRSYAYRHKEVFYSDGKLKFSSKNKGIRNNTTEYYHPDGSLHSKKVTARLRITVDDSFYPNGNKKRTTDWKKNTLQSWDVFHPNGNPWLNAHSATNSLATPPGPLLWYHSDGKKLAHVDFDPKEKTYQTQFFTQTGENIKVNGTKALDSILMFDLIGEEGLRNVQFGDTADVKAAPSNVNVIKEFIGYPQRAMENGIEGTIVVRVLVDEKGKTRFFYPVATVHPFLDHSIFSQVLNLTFEPAQKDGNPIPMWVDIPFNFVLMN